MTAKKTPEELEIAFSAESRQRKLIHQLEVKKWGIEQTAEKAAEMGDTETYLEYCKRATIIELQLETARRKLRNDVGDMPLAYGHSITPNMEL